MHPRRVREIPSRVQRSFRGVQVCQTTRAQTMDPPREMCRSRLYTHQMHVLYGGCTVHDLQLLLESFRRAPSDHIYRCLYNATSMGIRCVLRFRKQKMRLPSCFSLSSPCLLSLNRPRSHGCSWPPFLRWALLDAAFTLFLCATGQIYASTIKDGLGAIGLFAMGSTALIIGETIVIRTILCCFFIMAGVVDILSLAFAYNDVYNVYRHNLRSYGQMLPVSRDDA